MIFINISNIDELEKFKSDNILHLDLQDIIDKYATINDYAYMYYENKQQIIIPFTIKEINDKKYCFISENINNEIKNILTNFNKDKIKEISDFELFDLMEEPKIYNLKCFIINNKFYC